MAQLNIGPVAFSTAGLKTELETDPSGLGYLPHLTAGDDNGLADLLNAVRQGGGYQVARAPVQPQVLFQKIDPADFAALTSTDLQRLQLLVTLPSLDLSVSAILEKVTGVFAPGARTNQTVVQFASRDGSRAEVLWGPGSVITPNMVNLARTS